MTTEPCSCSVCQGGPFEEACYSAHNAIVNSLKSSPDHYQLVVNMQNCPKVSSRKRSD
jgi:hypothetical protein